jgi:hypothetical protein
MAHKSKVKSASELPLEITERTEIDPESGTQVDVTCQRRGVLKRETKRFQNPFAALELLSSKTPRQELEQYCDFLRERLRDAGLPTDETKNWIQGPSGEWEIYDPSTACRTSRGRGLMSSWQSRLRELTEPLSKQRLAGELLFALTQLLRRDGIDAHLWYISRLMDVYSIFQIAVTTNDVAAAGMRARKARASGPRTRRDTAVAKRAVVWQEAQEYWLERPIFRNDGANTAAAIADDVNRKLRSKNLLSKDQRDLKPKTIADYIRGCIRDNGSDLAKSETGMANPETCEVFR